MAGGMDDDSILKLKLHALLGLLASAGWSPAPGCGRCGGSMLASGTVATPQVVASTHGAGPVFQEDFMVPWPAGSTLTVQVVEEGVVTSAVRAEVSLVDMLAGAVTAVTGGSAQPGLNGARGGGGGVFAGQARVGHDHVMLTSGTSAPSSSWRAPTRRSSPKTRGGATSASASQHPGWTSQCPRLQPSEEGPKDLVVPWSCCVFLPFLLAALWSTVLNVVMWLFCPLWKQPQAPTGAAHPPPRFPPFCGTCKLLQGRASMWLPCQLHFAPTPPPPPSPPLKKTQQTITPPAATAQDQRTDDQGGTLCTCGDDSPRSPCAAASVSTVPSASAAAPGAVAGSALQPHAAACPAALLAAAGTPQRWQGPASQASPAARRRAQTPQENLGLGADWV